MELTQKILVSDVLFELDDREQGIIKLYYWAGFTEAEIAESYQITHQRVHQIKERALEKCKKLIEKQQPFAIIA